MKKVLFTLANIFFYGFLVFLFLVIIFSIFALIENGTNIDFPYVSLISSEGIKSARITLPIIPLMVEFRLSYIVLTAMIIGLTFYAYYFYSLKSFFGIFLNERMFSQESSKKLNYFFILNLVPICYALGISIVEYLRNQRIKFEEDQGIGIIHFLVAIVVYFYMDMLKKGKLLQEENDLTI